MFLEHGIHNLEWSKGIHWDDIVYGLWQDFIVRSDAGQESNVERTISHSIRVMLVHSPLVYCENSCRWVVRVISGAIVGGPSSKVGRIAVG